MVFKQSLNFRRKEVTYTNIRNEQLPLTEIINLGEIRKDVTSDIPERFGEASAV